MKYIQKYRALKNAPLFIVALAVVVLLIGFVVVWRGGGNTSPNNNTRADETEDVVAYFGETRVTLEVADTPERRGRGLSGREGLAEGTGMLFVFDETGRHVIGMKDIQFALDVLWLNETFHIIYMVENMTPESFPTMYYSRKPARYVVELPVGFVSTHNISIHDQMTPWTP